MEKNLILALVLSMVVIFAWFSLAGKKERVKPAEQPSASFRQEKTTQDIVSGTASKGKKSAKNIKPQEKEESGSRIIYTGETGVFRFSINENGGFSEFALIKENRNFFEPSPAGFLGMPEIDFGNVKKTAVPSGISLYLESADRSAGILYTFYDSENYFDVELKSDDETVISLGQGVSSSSEKPEENRTNNNFTYLSGKSVNRKSKAEKLAIAPDWVSVENKYYVAGIFPEGKSESVFEILKETKQSFPEVLWHSGKAKKFRVYAGEKRYPLLKGFLPGFEKVVDFGYFREIGKGLYYLLNFFYRLTKNYGIAIILVTFIVQTLMTPITIKNFKSMKAMRDIQPLINDLRVKYKAEPSKLNTEMMALYKEKKVNPFGGCLPMLLQIPMFWALFTTLRNVVELRGAHFIWWITDLSKTDIPIPGIPMLHILPIIMTGTMVLQQRMSPTTAGGDPQQAKMMAILMPAMFTVMFWSFPSGLVLYWLTNNVLSITTQYIYEHKSGSAKCFSGPSACKQGGLRG